MADITGIKNAFIDYCYNNVDELEWKKFKTSDNKTLYYRTRINKLEVVVGVNYESELYFFTVKSMGKIAEEIHKKWFPTKLQRLFTVIDNL